MFPRVPPEVSHVDSKSETPKYKEDDKTSRTSPTLPARTGDGLKRILYYYSCGFGMYLVGSVLWAFIEYYYTLHGERSGCKMIQTIQKVISSTYLSVVLQHATHAVDYQAKLEADQEFQSRPVDEKDRERQIRAEHTVFEKSEHGTGSSIAQFTTSHDIEAQGQPRKPMNWSLRQIIRKLIWACLLMIGGLISGPVALYLVQKLFLPCCVDDIRTNIQLGSLRFWSFLLIAVAGYGAILDKKKAREERIHAGEMHQNVQEPRRDFYDEESEQCG